jgi:hypothetical protein
MNAFIWYRPTHDHWIRCQIIFRVGSLVHIQTYDGQKISNLRVHKIYDAELCE